MSGGNQQRKRVPVGGNPQRLALVGSGMAVTGLMIFLPLFAVFYYALRDGLAFGIGGCVHATDMFLTRTLCMPSG